MTIYRSLNSFTFLSNLYVANLGDESNGRCKPAESSESDDLIKKININDVIKDIISCLLIKKYLREFLCFGLLDCLSLAAL